MYEIEDLHVVLAGFAYPGSIVDFKVVKGDGRVAEVRKELKIVLPDNKKVRLFLEKTKHAEGEPSVRMRLGKNASAGISVCWSSFIAQGKEGFELRLRML